MTIGVAPRAQEGARGFGTLRGRGARILVVGQDGDERRKVMRALIDRGHPVFVCPGPPGCALDREDRCVVIDAVELAVFLPYAAGDEETIRACVETIGAGVFARKPPFSIPLGVVVAGTTDALAIAATVGRLTRAR